MSDDIINELKQIYNYIGKTCTYVYCKSGDECEGILTAVSVTKKGNIFLKLRRNNRAVWVLNKNVVMMGSIFPAKYH